MLFTVSHSSRFEAGSQARRRVRRRFTTAFSETLIDRLINTDYGYVYDHRPISV